MESKAKMSSSKDQIRKQLLGVKEAYENDYGTVEQQTEAGMQSLKSRIANFKLDLQEKAAPKPTKPAAPKYNEIQIANRAIDTYKTNINPVNPSYEQETSQPNTYARRTNVRALAKNLAGQRVSGNAGKTTETTTNGNGDLGQYTSPASPNGGDLGNNTGYGQYYALTTNMTLEQYEEHIKEKFGTEEPIAPLTCGVCASDPCECNNELEESPLEDLKNELREMTDHSWQAIDKVMRKIASEYDITPKQLHKDFKSEEGMIPDEWVKVNEEVQLCGFMPLDEAKSITETGMVYDVTLMWRGHTRRHKFFWPGYGPYPQEKCQADVEKLYPGGRLIAHYPSIDDSQNNMIVMVPPMKENFEFIRNDMWEELDEETNDLFHQICEEVGEPTSSPVEMEDGKLSVWVSDHDTGEKVQVVFEKKGLWDNIHAKRKRGEKPAKPGDKAYPKTLNVEETEELDEAGRCWKGYKPKKGKKPYSDGSCVKEDMKGMSQKSGDKRSTESGAGMTAKGVAKYNRRTGGDLKTAVTTPPSKLKPGSKAAGRRKSFCARSRGWDGERGKAARRRWNC